MKVKIFKLNLFQSKIINRIELWGIFMSDRWTGGITSGLPGKNFDRGCEDYGAQKLYEQNKRLDLLLTSDLTKKIQFNPEYKKEIDYFFCMPSNKRIVLLHSVRGAGSEEPEFITNYVKEQETKGYVVYIPKKYNFQKDETGGIAICNTMRYVIEKSGNIAIGYNPDSEGTKFDYGMVIYNNNKERIRVLNPKLDIYDSIYNWMLDKREDEVELKKFIQDNVFPRISKNRIIPLKLKYAERPDKDGKKQPPSLAPFSALELGMIYATECPFQITNLNEVKEQSELEDKLGFFKSYSKVALKLHEIYSTK